MSSEASNISLIADTTYSSYTSSTANIITEFWTSTVPLLRAGQCTGDGTLLTRHHRRQPTGRRRQPLFHRQRIIAPVCLTWCGKVREKSPRTTIRSRSSSKRDRRSKGVSRASICLMFMVICWVNGTSPAWATDHELCSCIVVVFSFGNGKIIYHDGAIASVY